MGFDMFTRRRGGAGKVVLNLREAPLNFGTRRHEGTKKSLFASASSCLRAFVRTELNAAAFVIRFPAPPRLRANQNPAMVQA